MVVALATMALAAELGGRVGAGVGAGRVVGRADEEHGRIDAAGNTNLVPWVTLTAFMECWLWQLVHIIVGIAR